MSMTKNPHTISWFEVPVTSISRATDFYETVFQTSLNKEEFQGTKMAIFPSSGDKNTFTVHGALVEGEGYTPSQTGPLLYFNAGSDLTETLNKVEASGGKVTLPKTSIGEHGFMAHLIDTEGNRIALYSQN